MKKGIILAGMLVVMSISNVFANDVERIIDSEYGKIEIYEEVEAEDIIEEDKTLTSVAYDRVNTAMRYGPNYSGSSTAQDRYLGSNWYWKAGVRNEVTVVNNTDSSMIFEYRVKENSPGTSMINSDTSNDEVIMDVLVSPGMSRTFLHTGGSSSDACYITVDSPVDDYNGSALELHVN